MLTLEYVEKVRRLNEQCPSDFCESSERERKILEDAAYAKFNPDNPMMVSVDFEYKTTPDDRLIIVRRSSNVRSSRN